MNHSFMWLSLISTEHLDLCANDITKRIILAKFKMKKGAHIGNEKTKKIV